MEKYTSQEPMTTKKKLEHFWYYYKVHTIVFIIAVIIIGVSVRDCLNQVHPDFTVAFAGNVYISEENTEKITEHIKPVMEDSTGNGVVDIFVNAYALGTENDVEFQMAVQQKFMLDLTTCDSQLFIIDEATALSLKEQDIFTDIIQLTDSTFLKEIGINTKGMVLCKREMPLNVKKKEEDVMKAKFRNADKAAELLLK